MHLREFQEFLQQKVNAGLFVQACAQSHFCSSSYHSGGKGRGDAQRPRHFLGPKAEPVRGKRHVTRPSEAAANAFYRICLTQAYTEKL